MSVSVHAVSSMGNERSLIVQEKSLNGNITEREGERKTER